MRRHGPHLRVSAFRRQKAVSRPIPVMSRAYLIIDMRGGQAGDQRTARRALAIILIPILFYHGIKFVT